MTPDVARTITVEIRADTRRFMRGMMMAQLRFERSWRKRLRLRVALWRLNRSIEAG